MRGRAVWLLIASYYFYMSWNPVYALLIAGSTFVTFTSGILIDKCSGAECLQSSHYKKVILVLCLIINLGILIVFKYGNFLIDSFNEVLKAFHITNIPLGGNQKGKVRKAVNLMIVFLVSGLWHGADWSFVAWGGIHGFYQVAADFFQPYREKIQERMKIKTNCFSWSFLQVMVTFGLVVFAWIFFRADSITDALRFIMRIFVKPTPWLLFNGGIFELGLDRVEMNILVFSILLLILVDLVRYKKKVTIDVFLMEQNLWFEWAVIIGIIVMIFTFGEYGASFDAQQFIYFQF